MTVSKSKAVRSINGVRWPRTTKDRLKSGQVICLKAPNWKCVRGLVFQVYLSKSKAVGSGCRSPGEGGRRM